ncbi:MAG: hypothetical protein AAF744_14080 [Pseudomonadota bacterium]
MEHRSDTPAPYRRTMLPNWMFYGTIGLFILIGVAFVFAAGDGPEDTAIEQSPYRSVPTPMLGPTD